MYSQTSSKVDALTYIAGKILVFEVLYSSTVNYSPKSTKSLPELKLMDPNKSSTAELSIPLTLFGAVASPLVSLYQISQI